MPRIFTPLGCEGNSMTETVEIFEVGPRDGLQNQSGFIATADKIALIRLLDAAGFARIEAASFVSPKWVPQMADGAAVIAGLDGVRADLWALTPNARGLAGAVAAGVAGVAVFGSASEGFSRANINASIDESLERFAPVVRTAKAQGVGVRGYVSCVTDCPYDGKTPPENVARVSAALLAMGCDEISLGETLGRATADQVDAMLVAVLNEVPATRLAGHFHDTTGVALGNIDVSLAHGLRVFDASIGGLGGCPYAPGAAGNVATEAVHAHVLARGFATGLQDQALAKAAVFAKGLQI